MKIPACFRLLAVSWMLVLFGFVCPQEATGAAELVSQSTGGVPSTGVSEAASVDATGRYVAFESSAVQLVGGDDNFLRDIFLRDRKTGITLRINGGVGGAEPDGASSTASISHDGRYVAYASDATNLVAGDTNAFRDIFVYDRQANKTKRVSVRTGGGQALGGDSKFPAISGNGRHVAFVSGATNLVQGDTNNIEDVFVHDMLTKVTRRVSIRSDGNEVFGTPFFSALPSMSRDGRHVAFASNSADLVDGDAGGFADIFIHDRVQNTTTLVSRSTAGVQANNFSNTPSLSADGNVVAFVSNAANLDGAGGNIQVYAKNLRTGVINRVRPAATYSYGASLSADGNRVALVTKVGAASEQVEVVDRLTGTVFQPARRPAGTDTGISAGPSLSADGRVAVFDSPANGIVISDSNGIRDVIARPLFDAIAFTKITYQANESDPNVVLTVTREGLLSGAVSVKYSISAVGDTAKPGVDYNPAPKTGTLSWAVGDATNRTLTIPLLNTAAADGYRFFTVSLTPVSGGAVISVPTAKVVIRDQESDPVENRIGHRLRFKSIVARGTNWDNGLFRAVFTITNPAPLPSFPGFIQLEFNGNIIANANFDSVPARGQLVVEATGSVGAFPDGDLFAILFESTDNGPVKQDSGFAAGYIDNGTAPPSGGTTQPNVGVKSGPPPVTVKTITINGSGSVNEGNFADYTVSVMLTDNSTLNNVTPTWQASAFAINGAGRFTAGDVAAARPVTLTARVLHNGVIATKTRVITVNNVPMTPIITSSATAFGSLGKPFTYRITARHEPTQFAATNLPDGLTLNASTGFITGTPTVANTFNATMQASNGIGTDTEALTITIAMPSPLTVNIVGSGTVAPDLNGDLLDVGKTYKLVAKPGVNQLFAGWSGDITSEPPTLTFVMVPNLTLTATFVPNPYLDRAGVYVGLIQSNPPTHEAGGFFQATVSKSGLCTGKLVLSGKPRPFKTTLKANGASPAISLPRPGLEPINFFITLDVVGITGVINGALTSGPVLANIAAQLKSADTSALAGRYTVVLPGPATTSALGDTPDGSGYGTVIVGATGSVKLAGVLGDGIPFAQASVITIGNTWPVYAALYAKAGSVFGLATFTNLADSDFNASLAWFKPARPLDAFYPAGWPAGLVQDFRGARYAQPPVIPGLPAQDGDGNAIIEFSGGGLLGALSQPLNVGDNGSVTRIAPVLQNSGYAIAPATGLFKGTFFDPGAGKVRTVSGAVQQKLQRGHGVFRGSLQRTGNVILRETP